MRACAKRQTSKSSISFLEEALCFKTENHTARPGSSGRQRFEFLSPGLKRQKQKRGPTCCNCFATSVSACLLLASTSSLRFLKSSSVPDSRSDSWTERDQVWNIIERKKAGRLCRASLATACLRECLNERPSQIVEKVPGRLQVEAKEINANNRSNGYRFCSGIEAACHLVRRGLKVVKRCAAIHIIQKFVTPWPVSLPH